MLTRSFRAMGSDVELFLDARPTATSLLEAAEVELRRLETILSRFRPDSELSRLNEERSLRVGPELLELVGVSLRWRERTGGRFDPTVHDALVAAGYDRTFEELVPEQEASPSPPPPACAGHVEVDERRGSITLGPGCRIDLGGVAKGWAADRALAVLSDAGPALVNVGGDIACAGGPWHVGVDTPAGTFTLALSQCGVATSGRDRRRWLRDGREAHHLIDPSTGAPAEGDLVAATAVAATGADAEVLATSLFLTGELHGAAAEADREGVPAVLVDRIGTTVLAGGLG